MHASDFFFLLFSFSLSFLRWRHFPLGLHAPPPPVGFLVFVTPIPIPEIPVDVLSLLLLVVVVVVLLELLFVVEMAGMDPALVETVRGEGSLCLTSTKTAAAAAAVEVSRLE